MLHCVRGLRYIAIPLFYILPLRLVLTVCCYARLHTITDLPILRLVGYVVGSVVGRSHCLFGLVRCVRIYCPDVITTPPDVSRFVSPLTRCRLVVPRVWITFTLLHLWPLPAVTFCYALLRPACTYTVVYPLFTLLLFITHRLLLLFVVGYGCQPVRCC